MPKMSLKYRIVNTLIMNIPICIAICITAQLLGTGTVVLNLTLINFCLAYVVSFLVGMFIPLVPWGLGFAGLCKAKPNSLPFGLLVNVVVNFGYVFVNSIILTFFNVNILGHAPLPVFFISLVANFIPIYIVGYIVSFLWNKPAEIIAKKICGE